MRIQFILPIAGVAGGVKVVFEYANYLQKKGHQVQIIYPGKLFPDLASRKWRAEAVARQIKYKVEQLAGISEGQWYPLEAPLLHRPSLEPRYIPNADIIIATSFETAELVDPLPPRCGNKFYFIQADERSFADLQKEKFSKIEFEERVINTWKMPFQQITIANSLRKIIESNSKKNVKAVVINSVDTSVFQNKHKVFNQPRQIIMLSHQQKNKGVTDGLMAIQLVRQKYPDLKLVMFGVKSPLPEMPAKTDYYQNPKPTQLRELYSTSDIFLCPSLSEGGPLTNMEAMACGTAVVTTNVGAVLDYAIPDKTALVVEPGDPAAQAKAILRLLENETILQEISFAGQKYIQQFSPDISGAKFEKALTS